jgi:hypothetical protein
MRMEREALMEEHVRILPVSASTSSRVAGFEGGGRLRLRS